VLSRTNAFKAAQATNQQICSCMPWSGPKGWTPVRPGMISCLSLPIRGRTRWSSDFGQR